MFEIERAVADWREQMAAAGIMDAEVLSELEIHLRDELGLRVQSGLSVEAAFGLAAQRIGKSDVLAIEFKKATLGNEVRERKMKLLCIACVGVLYLCPFILSIPKTGARMDPGQRWLGIGAIVVSFLAMFSGFFLRGFLPIIPNKRTRTRIQFASVIPVFVWLIAFAFVILPRLDLTLGQVTVAALWAVSPLAILGGLAFGLDEAACRATA